MAPRICLNMIVRDEAAVIDRCLASLRGHIDAWVIVDTGSRDDTPARVQAALQGIPGALHHRPWHDFGHNRSEALELARGHGDYLLFIDADEQLGVDVAKPWLQLDQPAYSFETRFGELRYDRVSLVSTVLPWRWVGVLHEYLDAGRPVPQPRLPGVWLQVTPDGARSRDPDKFRKDAEVLRAALAREPGNARHAFYLAQSLRDAGELAAAREAYLARAAMGGWDEEVWYARWQAAELAARLGAAHAEVVAGLLGAWQARPQRAEPLVSLAALHRARNEWSLARLFAEAATRIPLPADRLFVDASAYRWRAQDELALALYYTGCRAEAAALWRALLAGEALPASERARVEGNLRFVPG